MQRPIYIYIYKCILYTSERPVWGRERRVFFTRQSPTALIVRPRRDVIDKYICIIHRARQFRSRRHYRRHFHAATASGVARFVCNNMYATRDAESRRDAGEWWRGNQSGVWHCCMGFSEPRRRGLAAVQLSEHNGATALCVIIIIAAKNQQWLTEWLRPKTGTLFEFP